MHKILTHTRYKLLDYINQSTNYNKFIFTLYLSGLFLLATVFPVLIFLIFGMRSVILLFLFSFSIMFSDLHKSLLRLFYVNDRKFLQLLNYNQKEYILSKELSRKIIMIAAGIWVNFVLAICFLLSNQVLPGIIYLLLTVLAGLLSVRFRIKLLELYIYKIRFITARFIMFSNIGIIIVAFTALVAYLYFSVWQGHLFMHTLLLYGCFLAVFTVISLLIHVLVYKNKIAFKHIGIHEFFTISFGNEAIIPQDNQSKLYASLFKQELHILRTNPPVKFHLFLLVSVTPFVIFFTVLFYLNQHDQYFFQFLGLLFLCFSPFIFYQQIILSFAAIDIDGKVMTRFGYIKQFIQWKVWFRIITSLTANSLIALIFIAGVFISSPITWLDKGIIAITLICYTIGTSPVGVLSTALFPNYKWEQITDIPTTRASMTNNLLISFFSLLNILLLWLTIHFSLWFMIAIALMNVVSFIFLWQTANITTKKRLSDSQTSFKMFME